MQFIVIAKPKAKETRVVRLDETRFQVWVREPPEGGRANEAVLRALAAHLDVSPSSLTLLQGHRSKQKIIAYRPAS